MESQKWLGLAAEVSEAAEEQDRSERPSPERTAELREQETPPNEEAT